MQNSQRSRKKSITQYKSIKLSLIDGNCFPDPAAEAVHVSCQHLTTQSSSSSQLSRTQVVPPTSLPPPGCLLPPLCVHQCWHPSSLRMRSGKDKPSEM